MSALDRERLESVVADRNRPRKHIERAEVILASTGRGPVKVVAEQVGVSRPMVWRWQQRFAEAGVDGLLRDKTRKPGKPPIPAETVARVVAMACGKPVGEVAVDRPRDGEGRRYLANLGAAHLAGARP